MANRIIKESTFTSDRIAQLSDFEFRLWVGLITQADDAGRGDARPAILKGRIFALRERVAIKDIDTSLHALAAYGCVSLYTVDGKPYYAFPSWAEHQRIRDAKPKYPAPNEDFDSSRQVAANGGESPRSAAIIQSESNTNTNPNTRESARAHFTPPSAEEVEEYCKENGYAVSAERFINYYASNGWKVGKSSMKDWRAAVRNWASRDKADKPQSFDVDEFFAKALARTKGETV